MAAALTALAVPLGFAYASHRTEHLLLKRRPEVTRFAAMADRSLHEGDCTTRKVERECALLLEIERYADLYDAVLRVYDRRGRLVLAAGDLDAAAEASARKLAGTTMRGGRIERMPPLGPFGAGRVAMAETAGRDAEVSGAVLLFASTESARLDILCVWALMAAAAVVALACTTAGAHGLARWILRPISELDATTRDIAEGRLEARIVPDTGPVELRRLMMRFNAMTEAVWAAIDRQQAFVANVSHELRSPLAVLSLHLENLQPHMDSEGLAGHEEAMAELGRLTALLDGMLALARVTSGPPAQDVDAVEELRPRLAAWEEALTARNLTLTVDLPAERRVRAVPDALTRITDTVLDNACKYVPEGGTVAVRMDGTALRFADDGPGLTAGECAEATERFWRAVSHENVPGSGLGLAIAADLAKSGGGALRLAPNEPHGLVVELMLADPAGARSR
ncbi:HAMP domain-containing histidine kinase [Actinomadura madurae]